MPLYPALPPALGAPPLSLRPKGGLRYGNGRIFDKGHPLKASPLGWDSARTLRTPVGLSRRPETPKGRLVHFSPLFTAQSAEK